MGGVELHTPGCLCREEIPGGSFLTGGFPGAAFGARDSHWSVDRRLVTSFMPGSATFLPHLTIRLPAYDAIAGVEAWAAGGNLEVCRMGTSGVWQRSGIIMFPAGRRAVNPMRLCGLVCG